MHIPDGILSLPVSAGMFAAGAAGVGVSARKARTAFDQRTVPLSGVAGAFVFAAQMINIPVPGGTSGHLLGGALLALVMGVSPAILVMSAVVLMQCLLFQDGGLVALGANLANMAVAGPLTGYAGFKAVKTLLPGRTGTVIGASVGGWLSLEVGAVLAGLQIGLSGTLPTPTAVIAMGSVHAIIGLLEAAVTGVVVAMLSARRPDLLKGVETDPQPERKESRLDPALLGGALISLLLALAVAHFASDAPDGLEHVMETHGIKEGKGFFSAPMPDYLFPRIGGWLGGSLAALLGLAGTFGLTAVVVRLLRRKKEG
jgi:cobalt/nickel transport system permease protein